VNKIASHIWIIENSELCVCHGNYDDYLYKKEHGISYDMSLFDDVAQMNMVLEEQL
jgi:ATPase subunit of ABC transporter with duplicated ATPase domains